jgi:membrane-associated protease RseP (regulator of RpoE activity)
MTRWLSLLIPLALLGGVVAAPLSAAESTLRKDDLRIATIGYRLAIAGRDLCPRQGPVTGMLLHHLAEYDKTDRPGLIAQGLDRGPGVLSVAAGSPADAAGLRAGDILLAVNGTAFESPAAIAAIPDREVWRPRVEASETMLLASLA